MRRNTLQILALAFSSILLVSLTGCFHKHTFADASCTEPKTCTVCGETEGEALGHTCEIGTCKQCGEFQNEDTWNSINEYIEKANSSLSIFLISLSHGNDSYTSITNSYNFIDESKKDLRSAHILCSNYSELRNLKSALNDALDYAPKGAPSPLSSSLMDFLTQLQTFASYIAYAQIEAIYIS